MKAKKLSALLMALVMAMSLTACGGGDTETPAPETPAVETPTVTVDPQPITPEMPVLENSIDFEDGNYDFAMIYMGGPVASSAELAVVEWQGSKALQVTNTSGGGRVYAAIDVSSILGADITKVASIEMSIGTAHDGGAFSAVSGFVYSWVGPDLDQVSDTWAVYLPSKNPMPTTATAMDGRFVADANNLIIVALTVDNGPDDGNGDATYYIDNIRFLDGAGNVIKGDTTVAFNPPAGFAPTGGGGYTEIALTMDGPGTSSGWGQAATIDTPAFDIAWMVPGMFITVYYVSDNPPEIIFQSWDGGEGWAKVAPAEDDGSKAKFTYDDIVLSYGDDFSLLNRVNVGDTDALLEVLSVVVSIPGGGGTEIALTMDGPGTSSGWGQAATIDTPAFDIAWLVPGSFITVYYVSEKEPEVILQSWDGGEGWAKVAPAENDGSKAKFTYDDMVAAYGDDFSLLNRINVGDTDALLEVLSVTITIPGGGAETVLTMDGPGTSSGWGQAATIDTPAFDIAWLTPGFVITVYYVSDNPPEVIFQSWDGGEGWAKVAHATDDGSKATFTYDDIVVSYGDDFSLLNRVNVGDTDAPLEVLTVTVNR